MGQRFPSIQRSTLVVVQRGRRVAVLQGELTFAQGYRITIKERLSFDAGYVEIEFYTIYIAPSQVAEFEEHGAGEKLDYLIQKGLVALAEPLTTGEREQAETLAHRIAAHPLSGDPNYRKHLPEAEAMVVATRPQPECARILLDELAARAVAEDEGLRIIGFPGLVGRAGLDGLLTRNDIQRLLTLCQRQGTHYSNRLIEHVAET